VGISPAKACYQGCARENDRRSFAFVELRWKCVLPGQIVESPEANPLRQVRCRMLFAMTTAEAAAVSQAECGLCQTGEQAAMDDETLTAARRHDGRSFAGLSSEIVESLESDRRDQTPTSAPAPFSLLRAHARSAVFLSRLLSARRCSSASENGSGRAVLKS
jgi:hypothetical protein